MIAAGDCGSDATDLCRDGKLTSLLVTSRPVLTDCLWLQVAALDQGVKEVEQAYKDAGLWEETITIFSTGELY